MVNKGKKPIIEEYSSYSKIEEVHHHTRLKAGATAPQDYKKLARDSDEEYYEYNNHSAIATPRSHASSRSRRRMVHMAEWSAKMNQRIEVQERLIRK